MIQDPSPTSSDSTSKAISAPSHGTQVAAASSSGTRALLQLRPLPRRKHSYDLRLPRLLLPGNFSPQQREQIGSWLLNELASGSTVTICGFGIYAPDSENNSPQSSEQVA